MEAARFDGLARALSQGLTRRGALRLLVGTLAAHEAPAMADAAARVTGDGKVTTQGDRNR